MRRSAQLTVCLTVFLDLLGFTLVLPGLPFAAEGLGANPAGVGVAMSVYSVAQFATAPLLGHLADRIGRRPILLASLTGSVLSLAGLAAAPDLTVLVAARALAGAFGGSIGVGQALMADITEPERRARAFGMTGAAIGAAFVLGPALGAGLASSGFRAAASVAAGLAAVNLVMAIRWLPHNQRTARPAPTAQALARHLLRSAHVRLVLAATLLTMLGFAGMEGTFALLIQRRFGLGPAWVGIVLTAAGVMMVGAQLSLVARVIERIGERAAAVTAALMMAAALAAMPFLPFPGTVAVVCLLAAGEGLFAVSSVALLTRAVPADLRGRVLSRAQSATSLARALGPAAAGALLGQFISLPYVLGAALILTAAAGLAVPQPSPDADRELAEPLAPDPLP